MAAIEIPFGAKDSELKGWEYTIPEDMEAIIENGKVIVREKKSEEERMWDKILNHFDWSFKGPYLTHEECDEIKDFLEKQKEQKSEQSEMEKEYVRTLHSLISDFLQGKQEIDREYYQQIWDWLDNRHIEQKPAEWSEEDEVNITDNKKFFLWIYNRLLYVYKEDPNIDYMHSFRKRIDQLFSKPQWKPSEEQMRALKEAINLLGEHKCSDILDNLLCDLDSLKPSWRPNEKQMEALKYFVDQAKSKANAATTTWDKYENICALYNDLKKL